MNITWDLGKDVTYEIFIANLGGYEKAKAECEARKRSGIVPAGLERALLQYRREHGIFEVGDKVVFKNTNDSFNRNGLGKNEILKIIDINFMDYLMFNISAHGFGQDRFRHATDTEIEAGKRLEVGDDLSN